MLKKDINKVINLLKDSPEINNLNFEIGGLFGASKSLFLSKLISSAYDKPFALFTSDTFDAIKLKEELSFFIKDDQEILIFPDWETLPYDKFSPHQDLISSRLKSLYKIPLLKNGIIIIPVPTLIQKLPPLEYVIDNSFFVNVGEKLNIDEIRNSLDSKGYCCVSEVIEHGEFAIRGSLIDIFPMGSNHPFRIDLFDDEIDSIRIFDPETQMTVDKVEQISLLPAREFPFDDDAISNFRRSFRLEFEDAPKNSPLYKDVSNGIPFAGIEYYLPFFFEELATIFDYLPDNTLLISFANIRDSINENWRQILDRFDQLKHDIERPIIQPSKLFLSNNDIEKYTFNRPSLSIFANKIEENPSQLNIDTKLLPPLKLQARHEQPAALLTSFIDQFEGKILLCTESSGRQETLLEVLQPYKIFPKKCDSWDRFLTNKNRLAITIANIETGFYTDDIAVIPESVLLGEKATQKRRRSQANRDFENAFKNLSDINIGTPVVHIDHGVGRYLGLQTLAIDGTETEFLTLEYANNDKLYVPVSSLHLISRYNGSIDEKAPLHRLGTDQWEKAKKKASEKIRDVASELLEIYAKRESKQGYKYNFDETEYHLFADSFPFEETPDQLDAIDTVIKSMQSEKPMDMVVCGDVGFGKTEVALRAAFIGTNGGKQVAMLVPTTLLAQQHYQNFKDRFADWPIRVEVLSRFGSKKEQEKILEDLASGKVDIAIGTHKLIQNDIKFKNLGLVIIDEEQRFGVRQKERFKELRNEVDILTLTATPIPRTLNLAMSGLRDLSIIATPPAKRLSIKTFISEWNTSLFKEACLREIKRGGQIYFLHNDVKTIEKITRDLQELIPEAKVNFAHGQMREKELEQVMLDFYHQRFNLLVCTTIIESGIDIPSANTIIINRADKLGLAQLHQLRGRVGRSHHRAYAYMITPPKNIMTADAVKRLEAIESLEDLGAGFMLANHDLEIRGAGELLGDEQSGQITEIGFSLYTELLEKAVNALKSGEIIDSTITDINNQTEIDLRIPALIPDTFIPDVHTRLVLYKRISAAKTEDDFKDLQVEMIDRFGLLPDQTKMLFTLSKVKIEASAIGINKIDFGPKGGYLLFGPKTTIDPLKIVRLVQHQSDRFRLDGQEKLKVTYVLEDSGERLDFVKDLVSKLT